MAFSARKRSARSCVIKATTACPRPEVLTRTRCALWDCREWRVTDQGNQEYEQDKIQCRYRLRLGRPILVRCFQPRARNSGRVSRPAFVLPLKQRKETNGLEKENGW